MKRKVDGLDIAVKVVKILDKMINLVLGLVIALALIYGGLGFWDIYQIYRGADVDNEILKYRPQLQEDGTTENPSLSELMKMNPDVFGWLTIDDTKIDYPVVQGKTNMEYINKALDGSFSMSGCIFLDSQNARDLSDYYSLLYGHHMEGENMFGALPNYKEKTFFDQHLTGHFFTMDRTYKIDIFACVLTDAYDRYLFNPAAWNDETKQDKLLDYMKEKAVMYREIEFEEDDQIIGMSTCYDASTDGRMMVFGKLKELK